MLTKLAVLSNWPLNGQVMFGQADSRVLPHESDATSFLAGERGADLGIERQRNADRTQVADMERLS